MARQTIVINRPVGSPIPSADLNDIGKNLEYILDEDTIFTGVKTFKKNGNSLMGYTFLNENIGSSFAAGVSVRLGDETLATASLMLRQSGDGSKHHSYISHNDDSSSNFYIENKNSVGSVIINANSLEVVEFLGTAIKLKKNTSIVTGAVASASYVFDTLVGAGAGNLSRFGQSGVTNGFTITTDGSELSYVMNTGYLMVNTAVNDYINRLQVNGSGIFIGELTANDIILPISDVLASRKISFEVAGVEQAAITFNRHTAPGTLADIYLQTKGFTRLQIGYDGTSTFTGNILPTATPAKGKWALTSTPFLIPRGRYHIAATNFGSNHIEAEMLCSDGTWRDIYNSQEGATLSGSGRGFWVESSGTDVRIFQIGGGTIDTYYNKY